MTIRRATRADAAQITAIWNDVIRDTLCTFNSVEKTQAEVEAVINGGAWGVFVAEDHGQVLGFASYGPFRGGVGYAHTGEHTLHLIEEARGQGLGRALMEKLESDATALGVHSLFAGVSSGNPGGCTFHTRIGYSEVAVLPQVGRKWDQWLDLHLMQKFLTR